MPKRRNCGSLGAAGPSLTAPAPLHSPPAVCRVPVPPHVHQHVLWFLLFSGAVLGVGGGVSWRFRSGICTVLSLPPETVPSPQQEPSLSRAVLPGASVPGSRARSPASPVMPGLPPSPRHRATQGCSVLTDPCRVPELRHRSGVERRPRVREARPSKPLPRVFGERPLRTRECSRLIACPNHEP